MQYPLYAPKTNDKQHSNQAILKGTVSCTLLSRLFFSDKNVDIIQNAIRYKVWIDTAKNVVISRQSDSELLIVMRSIFVQHAQHRPDGITEQISTLNDKVVQEVTPGIISEATAHLVYLKDKFGGIQPIAPPVNVNSAGLKQLRSVTSTF